MGEGALVGLENLWDSGGGRHGARVSGSVGSECLLVNIRVKPSGGAYLVFLAGALGSPPGSERMRAPRTSSGQRCRRW